MNITMNFRILLLCICVLAATNNRVIAQTPTIIPGEIPTSYDVSASGAFQYSVPLRIPPGIKDMVPNLAITYNSQGGNGMLGMGWSLSGLSAITRGMPNLYYDQKIAPLSLGTSDVLFLDGQRLFWNSSTSTYLTEVKNFAKIEGHGTAGSGYSYFTVEYPNGTVYEYGNSNDSRMLAKGKSELLMWGVNKIKDVYGNSITFEYTNVQSAGEYRIHKITYGENSNTGNDIPLTIEFDYTTRQDENISWVAGSEISSNKLLDNITVLFSDSTQANQYLFSYDMASIHPRLIKIQEMRDGIEILKPININWGTTSSVPDVTLASTYGIAGTTPLTGDFNGDGFTDYVLYSPSLSGTIVRYINDKKGDYLYSGISGYPTTINSASYMAAINNPTVSPYNKMIFDYDGDGLDDIIIINLDNTDSSVKAHTIFLIRANGLSTIFDQAVPIYVGVNYQNQNVNFNSKTHFIPGDFDGDGKKEIIIAAPYNFDGPNVVEDYEIFIVGDEYSSLYSPRKINHIARENIKHAMALDYNGDGKDEFIFTFDDNVDLTYMYNLKVEYNASTLKPSLIQSSTQWPMQLFGVSNLPSADSKNWLGDFNGDGRSDLLFWNETIQEWFLSYSDGKSNIYGFYEDAPIWVTDPNSPHSLGSLANANPLFIDAGSYSIHIGDFNGDGLDDILQLMTGNNTTLYNVYYSTGMDFIEDSGNFNVFADCKQLNVGDFNGDGQVDILSTKVHNGYNVRVLSFYKNNREFNATSIEHAGKTVNVQYKTIPQDTDYVKIPVVNSKFSSRTLPLKLAKRVYDNITLDNKYVYQGFTFHKYGLGLRGFKKFNSENNIGQKIYRLFELEWQIPHLVELKVLDSFGSLPYGSRTIFTQTDVDGGAGGKSRIILMESSVTDYISGQITEKTLTKGSTSSGTVLYDFGQVQSIQVRTKDLIGGNNSLQTSTYSYGANWVANKGKPESVTVYSEIDPNGANGISKTTNYTYNSSGDIATITTHPGTLNEKTETRYYDGFGNIWKTEVNATGVPGTVVNLYGYSTDGKFLVSTEDVMGYTHTYDYGSLSACWGNLLSETNAKGLQTDYEYDVLNRVTKVTDVSHTVSINTHYDWASGSQHTIGLPNPQMIVTTSNTADASYNMTVTDKYGRTIRKVSTSFLGTDTYEDISYNDNSLVAISTAPYPANNPAIKVETTFTYDPFNRETARSTDNSGQTIGTSYSIALGLLNTTVTNLGTGKTSTTISCGSLVKRIFGNTEDIAYTYHGNGTPYTITTNGLQVVNLLDPFGRIEKNTQPNAGLIEYEYDALDRVKKEKLATGKIYEYTYDLLGRITEKKEQGSPLPPYLYRYYGPTITGGAGSLQEEKAPNGYSFEYQYNAKGELIMKKENTALPFPLSTTYAYYPDGKLMLYRFYNDITVQYNYNYLGYLNEAELLNSSGQLNDHKLWFAWDKNQLGQLEAAYHFDRSSNPLYGVLRSYDVHGYPTNRKTIKNLGLIPLTDEGYTFNVQNGNLTDRTDNMRGLTESFDYDTEFDRLTDVTPGPGIISSPQTIEYDTKGNILKKSDITTSGYDFKYDKYALITVPEPNTRAFEIPPFTQDVDYTTFQKVEKITEDTQNEIVYTYGPDDERVKADYYDISVGGAPPQLIHTKYYGQNYERVEAANGDKTEIYYVWAGDELISIFRIHTPFGNPPQGAVYYPVRDHLGSITHLLDDLGAGGIAANGVIEERSFDAWGRVRDPNNWMPYLSGFFPTNWLIDRGYTGHEHIWSVTSSGGTPAFYNNIINMNGRLYDPLVGRMFSPDPYIPDGANSQDYNKYMYARNNPLKYTDPDGEWVHIAIGAVIGGAINTFTHWDDITAGGSINWGKAGAAFGIGAVAGAVTAATGGALMAAAAPTTIGGVAAAGGMSGAFGAGTGALIRSYGNHAAFGDPLMTDKEFFIEVGLSGVTSGITSGLTAVAAKIFAPRPSIEFGKAEITKFGNRVSQGNTTTKFTKSNFRNNLIKATGSNPGKEAQAHHVFPKKFESIFNSKGIDINDPQFGAWWETTSHLKNVNSYNRLWENFLRTNPTQSEIFNFGRQIMQQYSIPIGF